MKLLLLVTISTVLIADEVDHVTVSKCCGESQHLNTATLKLECVSVDRLEELTTVRVEGEYVELAVEKNDSLYSEDKKSHSTFLDKLTSSDACGAPVVHRRFGVSRDRKLTKTKHKEQFEEKDFCLDRTLENEEKVVAVTCDPCQAGKIILTCYFKFNRRILF